MMTEASEAPVIEAAEFKGLMRHVAGAVTVITCGRPGERRGLTATAICSLSDSPPTVLACVNRKSSAHDLIIAERAFVVNVLAGDQRDVAVRFSGQSGLSGEERFADRDWGSLSTGAPVLDGALAAFDCELIEHKEVATHTIFIARVVSGRSTGCAQSLIYLKGNYHTLPAGA
jgi:flavin reductase (DIM6/NTAB) family NADH-FMN oxidoreductase RutF